MEEIGLAVLPDIQAQKPEHAIALSSVGVSNFRYPVSIFRSGATESAIVTINAAVNVPDDQRGAHMSRFAEEITQAFQTPLEVSSIEELPERLSRSFLGAHEYASNCTVMLEMTSHVNKHVYTLFVTYDTAGDERILGVEVAGALACPCAIALTGGQSHNQRGMLRIELCTNGNKVSSEELVGLGERSFSTPVRLLLKRPDEKAVVEAMHDNPKFVEDVVRDCVVLLKELFRGLSAKVRCLSFESIHPYDCFAEWDGTL